MRNKRTLVLGASEKIDRYSNRAVTQLRMHGHDVVAIGRKAGRIDDVEITTTMPEVKDLDTITLYLNPINQKPYYDYMLSLSPRRIIFNPGTENDELERLAMKNGIEVMEACTLVLLSTGQY